MAARIKTDYPGVYYYMQPRLGGSGQEKVYYVVFKSAGKVHEEKAGRQYQDNMTPAKAARVRAALIEGTRDLAKVKRAKNQAAKEAEANRPTIFRLWELYKAARPNLKGLVTDENRFQRHIAPAFGDNIPKEIDPLSIDRFRVRLGKTLTPKTTANVLELLRRIINFGRNRGLYDSRLKIRLPKVDNLQTEALSPEQLSRLLETLSRSENQVVANIMRMALFTGMRKGEILKLEWCDVDFDRGFITIREPKGGQSQKIPMNGQARAMLEALPRKSSFVFPGRGGEQRVEIRRAARKICDAAGLPQNFRPMHGLRHAYASMLASSGKVDLYTLQRLLTHKSAAMTQRYAHLHDEALQRAAAVAGGLIDEAVQGWEPGNVISPAERKLG